MMTQFSEWPSWLQALVVAPHALLGFVAVWLWWPKSEESRRRFGYVEALTGMTKTPDLTWASLSSNP